MKTITWNGISSLTVPGLVIGPIEREILGKPRGVQVNIPGRPGFTHFAQPRGSRQITVEGFIEADTFQSRRDRFELLADWLDVPAQAPLIISDTPDVYYEAVVQDTGAAEEWRNVGTFELVWEAQPYSLALLPVTESWVSTPDTVFSFSPGLRAIVYPIIQVQPTNGTLTSFALTVNGDTLFWEGNLADESTLTINSIAAVVLNGINDDLNLVGAYDPTDVAMTNVSGTFPVLTPATPNAIRFLKGTGTATTFDLSVTYRKTYRK